MRIFLDTNVLVSAFATRGLCSDVFRETRSFHELLISELLLKELERILKDKMQLPQDLVADSVDYLRQTGLMSEPAERPIPEINDPDDIPLLTSALNEKAETFVTGDKEILRLKQLDEMVILDPRSFWELLKSGQAH